MTKSTSAKLPHRKNSHKCPPRGCGKEHKCQATSEKRFTQGARATSCHCCWCAQKLPQNPCGQGQFWPPGREKNIKIASKSPPAGPVFAKTQFFSVFCASHIPRRIPTRAEKKTKNARSRGGAQRNSYRHGTTSAQKARVAKKTMFFARASGRRKLARFSQGT